jgi:hypothetical protein
MVGRRKAIRTLAAAATVVSSFTLPAYCQGFGKRGGGPGSGYPVENHQRSTRKLTRLRLIAYLRLTRNTIPGVSLAQQSPRRQRKNQTRDQPRQMR